MNQSEIQIKEADQQTKPINFIDSLLLEKAHEPIWIHSPTVDKPFYAILHCVDVDDLEPATSSTSTG
ncbi:hypothetical protein Fmac_029894 [Flemingia macrophylla]|uniref:Uncharacterized protein n=1 Tax=Flemingia macrophylla TaxID=520843 RepID=A0ABD1LBM1_9FABA